MKTTKTGFLDPTVNSIGRTLSRHKQHQVYSTHSPDPSMAQSREPINWARGQNGSKLNMKNENYPNESWMIVKLFRLFFPHLIAFTGSWVEFAKRWNRKPNNFKA